MRKKIIGSITLASTATACGVLNQGMSGTFEPACIAHAGDRIVLADGRFEWDKFTDAIEIDDDGNRIDPFPGFPKTGSFDKDGDKLTWSADDGAPLDSRYLVEYRGETYLLTWDQSEAFGDGEPFPACALKLDDNGS